MADPITIISIVGGAASAGWELSQFLYQMVDTVKNGREEVRRLAHGLVNMSNVLEHLKKELDEAEGLYKPLFIKSIQSILEDYSALRKTIESHIKKKGRMQRVRWIWRSMKVEKPLKELEALKSALDLNLQVMKLAIDHKNHRMLRSMQEQTNKIPAKSNRFRRIAETIIMKNRENILELQEIKAKEEKEEFGNQSGQLQTWRVSNQIVADKTATWLQKMIFAPEQDFDSPNERSSRPPDLEEATGVGNSSHHHAWNNLPQYPPLSTWTNQTEDIPRPPPTPPSRWVLPNRFWKPDPAVTMDRLLEAWSTMTQEEIQESRMQNEPPFSPQVELDQDPDDSSDDEDGDSEADSLRAKVSGGAKVNSFAHVPLMDHHAYVESVSTLDGYPTFQGAKPFGQIPSPEPPPPPPPLRRPDGFEYTERDRYPWQNPWQNPGQNPGQNTWQNPFQPSQNWWTAPQNVPHGESDLLPTKTYKDDYGNSLRLSGNSDGQKALYIDRSKPYPRARSSPVPTNSVLLHGLASPGNAQSSKLTAMLKRKGISIFNLDSKPPGISTLDRSTELERASVMNGSIMWEPGQYPSEFLVSCSNIGIEVMYIRGSDLGQTWFCGKKPFHVNFFNPDYVPQTSWSPGSTFSPDQYLAIGREWVEMETLENQGIAFRKDHPAFYFLEPDLSPEEIVEAVTQSFTLREASLRRQTRLHICGMRKAPRPLTTRGMNHFFPQSRPSTASTLSGATLVNESERTKRPGSYPSSREVQPDPAL
ncbi:hypothetical protein HDK77DRAFT_134867 [Phyllosticta capitalensis]|uniref:uncharacterized protein n=1 Tax=Phyllosticta capitalensis TaxID=121624 RepID=UPI00312DDF9C